MKKIEKERKSFETWFVAEDGTEFRSEEECRNYDNTAQCVLNAKYRQLVFDESNSDSLVGWGSEDERIDVVKLKSDSDIDVLLHMYFFENAYIKENNERYDATFAQLYSCCKKSVEEDDFVLIERGYEGDGFWLIGSRNDVVAKLQKIGKPEPEPEPAEESK